MLDKLKLQRFAVLYVKGPDGVRGDWAACEALARIKLDPDDQQVRDALVANGGTLPNPGQAREQPAVDFSQIERSAKGANSDAEWKRLAKELEPVTMAIAKGEVRATAAQGSLIKHILERAHGRVVATQSEKNVPTGVVILPTLGAGNNLRTCPKCGYRVSDE